MSETRLDRALFAARLRAREGKDRTLLSTEAVDDVCAELLRLYEKQEAAKLAESEKTHG